MEQDQYWVGDLYAALWEHETPRNEVEHHDHQSNAVHQLADGHHGDLHNGAVDVHAFQMETNLENGAQCTNGHLALRTRDGDLGEYLQMDFGQVVDHHV